MIEFRNVCKAYRTTTRRKVLLDNFSLTLPAGRKVGVLGRNGAGKSTLLGMVAGIAKPIRAASCAMPRSPGLWVSRAVSAAI